MKKQVERRQFLKYMGAAAVGPLFKNLFSIKKKSVEYLMPYVVPPKGVIPGKPNWYSSTCKQCSAGCGIKVKTLEGRAKKIEGNELFPVNEGRVCSRGQAGLQALYNPDRIKSPLVKENGKFKKVSWSKAESILAAKLQEVISKKSNGVSFITNSLRGTEGKLLTEFSNSFGPGNIYPFEYFADGNLAKATENSFGINTIPNIDIKNSKYVLSFSTDLLDTWASPVKHSVFYGKMRDKKEGSSHRGDLVQFESRLSITGSNADEWHPIKPGSEGVLALSIANVIVEQSLNHSSVAAEIPKWKELLEDYSPEKVSKISGVKKEVIEEVAKKFAQTQPSVAIGGSFASNRKDGIANAEAANLLNHLVGSVGQDGGLKFPALPAISDSITPNVSYKKLKDLAKAMNQGTVEILLIHNANPIFHLPPASKFASGIKKVPFVVSFSSFIDDTTAEADLILPDNNYLESWGDSIPLSDSGHRSVGIMQPIVEKRYNTKQIGDTLLSVAKKIGGSVAGSLASATFLDYLKQNWNTIYKDARVKNKTTDATFESFWKNCLKNGGWWEDEESNITPGKKPNPDSINKPGLHEESSDYNLNLHAYPSINLYDGRSANLPWLQQLPEPLVSAAWGTWVEINPKTAKKLHITEGDILEIKSKSGKISAPAYIYPAIHPETIGIPIGQGHKGYGRYAKGRGANALQIINSDLAINGDDLAWASTKVKITKTNETVQVIKTDPGTALPGIENGVAELGRELVQWIEPEEAKKLDENDHKLEPIEAVPELDRIKNATTPAIPVVGLKPRKYPHKYRWGMVVDLDKCTGCQACMVSCYAEQNMPLVNDVEMGKYRHKNWLRLDRYWEGEYPKIRAKVIPVNCYQCGKAPCEPACFIYASFRTSDGLNGQVYQRCVGTRYCNVACPYRSRLFNWTNPEWPKPLNEQLNPEVSVRQSGVTDKCSFCANRIREAKDKAKDENRKVKDGEVQPACAQTCPTGAITFGDLRDHNSEVSKLTRNPRRYRLLEEMNVEPGVIFLKAIRKGAIEHKESGGAHGEESSGEKNSSDEGH